MGENIRLFLLLGVVYLTNIVQVITGFAGTMLAMPFAIWLIGVEEAKAIFNFLGLAASVFICVRYREDIVWREFLRMSGIMLLGIAIGIWLFQLIPTQSLLFLYGLLILGIAMKKLWIKKEIHLPDKVMLAVILTAGIVHGMFVSGGALLVIYAVGALREKKAFRATLSAVWVLLNTVLFAQHIWNGIFDFKCLQLSLVSLVPLAAAFWTGNYLYGKLRQESFLKLTYVLLLISGLSLLM